MSGSQRTNSFVPALRVTGRSVFGRTVKHGIPQIGGLLLNAPLICHDSGSMCLQSEKFNVSQRLNILPSRSIQLHTVFCVTMSGARMNGKITGQDALMSTSAEQFVAILSILFTFAGR